MQRRDLTGMDVFYTETVHTVFLDYVSGGWVDGESARLRSAI